MCPRIAVYAFTIITLLGAILMMSFMSRNILLVSNCSESTTQLNPERSLPRPKKPRRVPNRSRREAERFYNPKTRSSARFRISMLRIEMLKAAAHLVFNHIRIKEAGPARATSFPATILQPYSSHPACFWF